MLRFCVKKLINEDLKRSLKSQKHSKFKHTQAFLSNILGVQTNLTFSHAPYRFLYLSRKFHASIQLKARIFKDVENIYAYNILQGIPVTDREVFAIKSPSEAVSTLEGFNGLLDQNWRSKTGSEVVEGFKSALGYCKEHNVNLSDVRFDKLVDGLMDHVQELTDSELSDLLLCISEYPLCESYTAHNFHDIWSALDDVCCWKVNAWSNETLFLFAEHWYRLHLGKFSDFMFNFMDRMSKRTNHMTKDELVHLFFYLKIHKRHEINFEFHYTLDKCIDRLTLQETAIAAMAFVRSETKIKLATTAAAMAAKLKDEVTIADEICVRRIVEVLRYSSHVLLVDQLLDLLDHLVPEIDRLSNLCCIHIALLGTTLQFFHEKSLEKVSQKIQGGLNDPNQVRLKDMERLLVALTMFDFNPQTETDIYNDIYKELHRDERRQESAQYPRCLPCTLNFLSIRNLYSYELMNELLDKDSYVEIYGKNYRTFSRELFSLDVDIEIECPDYTGNRLEKPFRHKVAKWLIEYTPSWDQHKKLTAADKFYLNVVESVAKVVRGQQNLRTEHILPNYVKSDIIICKDDEGNFVQPSGFVKYALGEVMRPPNSSLRWFAVLPVNWNNAAKNTKKPLGLINKKCRQLKTIGYEPILVMWSEFMELNDGDKIKYMQEKLR